MSLGSVGLGIARGELSLWMVYGQTGKNRNCRVGGGARNYARAGLRPPLELHVQFSRMQLWQRLSDAGMQEKELNQSAAQVRTRRRA